MLDENELLFDELYEKTKDCGRVQFINLLINKERENKELKQEIVKYKNDRGKNTKRYLELQEYIKSRIDYCKEITGFDCCVEELDEILKMI